jgi:hypothetical protein
MWFVTGIEHDESRVAVEGSDVSLVIRSEGHPPSWAVLAKGTGVFEQRSREMGRNDGSWWGTPDRVHLVSPTTLEADWDRGGIRRLVVEFDPSTLRVADAYCEHVVGSRPDPIQEPC